MPRTTMSMASGKASVNFLIRDLAIAPTTQRGRPRPAAKARPKAISGILVTAQAISSTTRARPPLIIQKELTFMPRPAWRSLEETLSSAFFCSRSWSLRVFRICLRRCSWAVAAGRRRPASRVSSPPTRAWARFRVLASAVEPPARARPTPAMATKPRTAISSVSSIGYSAASRASASSRSRP